MLYWLIEKKIKISKAEIRQSSHGIFKVPKYNLSHLVLLKTEIFTLQNEDFTNFSIKHPAFISLMQ